MRLAIGLTCLLLGASCSQPEKVECGPEAGPNVVCADGRNARVSVQEELAPNRSLSWAQLWWREGRCYISVELRDDPRKLGFVYVPNDWCESLR